MPQRRLLALSRDPRLPTWAMWVAVAVGLLLRVDWLRDVPTQPVTDFAWYFDRAAEMARGLGYQVEGRPTAYWPVGYPGFLSLLFRITGPSVEAARLANALLSAGVVLLGALVARRFCPQSWIGAAVAVILAFHPAWIAYGGILASEPLYTALTLVGLWQWPHDGKRPWLSGMAFGLATLVRPQAVLLPVTLVALDLWRNRHEKPRRVLPTAILLGVALLPPLAWTARNAAVLGAPAFVSTNGGDNLWIGASGARYQTPAPFASGEIAQDRAARQAGLALIRQDPAAWLAKAPEKLRQSFISGSDAPYWAFQTERDTLIVPGAGRDKALYKAFQEKSNAWPPALVAFAVLGLFFRPREAQLATPLIVIGLTALLSVVFFGNPRFGLPATPFLAYLAVLPLLRAAESLRPAKPERDGGSQNGEPSPTIS